MTPWTRAIPAICSKRQQIWGRSRGPSHRLARTARSRLPLRSWLCHISTPPRRRYALRLTSTSALIISRSYLSLGHNDSELGGDLREQEPTEGIVNTREGVAVADRQRQVRGTDDGRRLVQDVVAAESQGDLVHQLDRSREIEVAVRGKERIGVGDAAVRDGAAARRREIRVRAQLLELDRRVIAPSRRHVETHPGSLPGRGEPMTPVEDRCFRIGATAASGRSEERRVG